MDELTVLPPLPWAAAAVALVLLVGVNVPPGGPRTGEVRTGGSPVGAAAGAVVAVVLAVAAVLAARLGPDSELDNPVPAVVVGLGWPLLFVLPPLLGPLVRRVLPPAQDAPADVRPAVGAALAVVAFLVVPVNPTSTTAVGTAVGAYALLVAAVAVAFGRATAARGEVLGLLGRWAGLGPRATRWAPPTGATAVLAVVLGGAWAERYERTASWQDGLPTRTDLLLGLALALLLAGLLAAALDRTTRAVPGTAAAVLLPLAAAAAVAGVARRALISAQLVAGGRVEPDPLGVAGGQGLALGVVAVGGALAAAALARRSGPGAARLPGLAVVMAITAVSATVVLQV